MTTDNHNVSLFGIALGLELPWYVEEVKLLDNSESSLKELHIYLNFVKDSEFVLADGRAGKCYDTVDKVWQHESVQPKIDRNIF